jgi:hypothetical protein
MSFLLFSDVQPFERLYRISIACSDSNRIIIDFETAWKYAYILTAKTGK